MLSAEEIKKNVTVVKGDVADYSHLTGVIKQYNCEKVVHLAALLLHDVNVNPALGLKLIAMVRLMCSRQPGCWVLRKWSGSVRALSLGRRRLTKRIYS
jgi:hypothetical protein